MWRDPFTLIVAVGADGNASGRLYVDDGDSYDYESGQFVWREFKLDGSGKTSTLSNHNLATGDQAAGNLVKFSPSSGPWAEGISTVQVEQIVVLGLKTKPTSVQASGTDLEWSWVAGSSASTGSEGDASKLTIKNPKLKIVDDWSITL
jgi:alpha 1,3-glucosidase